MQAASQGPFRLTCENDGVRLGPDCAPADEILDRGVKRQLIFNAKDEAIFELALRESFPLCASWSSAGAGRTRSNSPTA